LPLAADLHERLAVYTRAGQVRCKGCGRWVVEEEAQAQRWGYYQPYAADKLYPYCAECARVEFGLRLV
jgi:hypothetical protein